MKVSVNAITVAIVIMLLEIVNVAPVLLVRNVWIIARAIISVLIAQKLAVVRIKRNVTNRTAIVLARMDGQVSIVAREIVLTICMDPTVKKLVNVTQTTPICVTHGPVNVIAKLDGVVVFVTDLVRSLHTAKIAKYPVTARTVLSARRQMVHLQ